ncbi:MULTISPECIES: class I adenylate-forming enzyme family protein [unclassified Nocardioides]|uniref:class I adenylate-forming enzyme family protein n=1 Tax=unclassified Nocardioides TaxID=2615069 RepID=UPI003623A18B
MMPLPLSPTVRCGDWPRLSARRCPDRIALIADGRELTFAEFNSRVNRAATSLRDAGISRGDRVAIFANDTHRYLEVVFACMKLGAVYVPLNPRLTGAELQRLLDVCEPASLFYGRRYADLVSGVRATSIKETVCLDSTDSLGSDYEAWAARGVDEEIDTEVDDNDLACLAFTSGTTGTPKAVMHSQAFTKYGTMQSIVERRLPEGAVHYSASSLFHISGRLYALAGVMRGSTSLLLPQFEAATVLEHLGSGRVHGAFLVPTMIGALLDLPAVADADFSALQSIVYGGAPMSVPLLRRAMETFDCDFIQMFGAGTEAGLQTVLTPEDHRRALDGEEHLLGSIGRPGFGVDLRLVDEKFRDVPAGAVGEIATRADACMSGYLDHPEETARAQRDGWVRSGDLARADEESFLYLQGRRDDMILRGGENIYPKEIEEVLSRCPGVREVAVVGVPDQRWGQIVRAHVVLTQDAAQAGFDAELARSFCRVRLAAYKVPAEFRIEARLPRNATGKLLKTELLQEGRPTA